MLLVWIELIAVQAAWPGCAGAAASFAGACCLVAPPARLPSRPLRIGRRALGFAGLVAAGLAVHPWLGLLAARIFVALGGSIPRGAPDAPCAVGIAAALLAAPLFEEALYRGRLLVALRPFVGAPLAIVVASVAFALPHLDPLRLVACFIAGLVLGHLFVLTRRTWPCVALHVGFNAAALSWPHPAPGQP